MSLLIFIREGPLEAVLQSFPEDTLLIEDKAFIVQVYVLVTSVSPLRVYRHHEGHVHFVNKEQVCMFTVSVLNLGHKVR